MPGTMNSPLPHRSSFRTALVAVFIARRARSFAFDPEVFMDEPFAALDAQTRKSLQDELLRIWEAIGKTILFISHGIDEAIHLGQRVAALTSRPCRIRKIVDIDRTVEDVRSRFRALRHHIWSLLHHEVQRARSQELEAVTTSEEVHHV